MKILQLLNGVVNAKHLDMYSVNNVLQKLRENFFNMQEVFKVTATLKMHILFYHYEDYLEKSGESLLYTSDEVPEAVHSRFRMFEERHGYRVTRKGTDSHKKKQHMSAVHFNGLNLGNI